MNWLVYFVGLGIGFVGMTLTPTAPELVSWETLGALLIMWGGIVMGLASPRGNA